MIVSRKAMRNLTARYAAVLKKCALINFLLASVLAIGVICHSEEAISASGSESEPYILNSGEDVYHFLSNTTFTGVYGKVYSDISISDSDSITVNATDAKYLIIDTEKDLGGSTSIVVGNVNRFTVKGSTDSSFSMALSTLPNETLQETKIVASDITISNSKDNGYAINLNSVTKGEFTNVIFVGSYVTDHYNGISSTGIELNTTGNVSLSSSYFSVLDKGKGINILTNGIHDIDILESKFSISSTSNNAYGVYISPNSTGILSVRDSSFTISGIKSYGIFSSNGIINIDNNTDISSNFSIINNATGIFINSGTASIERAKFYGDKNGEEITGLIGTGITIAQDSVVTIKNSDFKIATNGADKGYGVYIVSGSTKISCSSFTGDGIGVYNANGYVEFSGKGIVNSLESSGEVVNNGELDLTGSWGGIESSYGNFTNNGVINMASDANITVNDLFGSGDFTIAVSLTNPSKSSKIIVRGIQSDATINLSHVNVVQDATAGGSVRYVDNGNSSSPLGVSYGEKRKFVTSTKIGTYNFYAEGGLLSWDAPSSGSGFTLAEFIHGNKESNSYCSADSYSVLSNDTDFTASTTFSQQESRGKQLSVYLNSHILSGSSTGITVSDGYSLDISNGTISGFTTALKATGAESKITLWDVTFAESSEGYRIYLEAGKVNIGRSSFALLGKGFSESVESKSATTYGVYLESGTANVMNSTFVVDGEGFGKGLGKGKGISYGLSLEDGTTWISDSSFTVGSKGEGQGISESENEGIGKNRGEGSGISTGVDVKSGTTSIIDTSFSITSEGKGIGKSKVGSQALGEGSSISTGVYIEKGTTSISGSTFISESQGRGESEGEGDGYGKGSAISTGLYVESGKTTTIDDSIFIVISEANGISIRTGEDVAGSGEGTSISTGLYIKSGSSSITESSFTVSSEGFGSGKTEGESKSESDGKGIASGTGVYIGSGQTTISSSSFIVSSKGSGIGKSEGKGSGIGEGTGSSTGVYIELAETSISDSSFTVTGEGTGVGESQGEGSGIGEGTGSSTGVYMLSGTASILDSSFSVIAKSEGSASGTGYGVYLDSSYTEFNRCSFIVTGYGSSEGSGFGYGIYIGSSESNISESSFDIRLSGVESGSSYGVYLDSEKKSKMSKTRIDINATAVGYATKGYGLYLKSGTAIVSDSIFDITFTDCAYGGEGYGIYLKSGIASINSGSSFDIKIIGEGGYGYAVYVGSGTASISDTSFDINLTESVSGEAYGVYVDSEKEIEISKTSFEINTTNSIFGSGVGTGVYVQSGKASIRGKSSFDIKVAGSDYGYGEGYGLRVESGTVSVNDTTFEIKLTGTGIGTGVYVQSGTVSISEGSSFQINVSGEESGEGYGVLIDSGTANISESSFDVRSTGISYSYGVLVASTGRANISNSTFTGNGISIYNCGIVELSGKNDVDTIQSSGSVINNGYVTLNGIWKEGDYSIYGSFTNNGILNMASGATIAVSSLDGGENGQLTIGVDLSDSSKSSKITVGHIDATGVPGKGDKDATINLTHVNIVRDGDANSVTYVDVAETQGNLILSGSYQINGSSENQIVTSTIAGTYFFTLGEKGKLNVLRDSNLAFTLAEFINGVKDSSTYCIADSYSLSKDSSGLAPCTTFSQQGSRTKELTVYLNGHGVSGSGTGITVANEYILTISNGTMSDFSSAALVRSGAILNITDMTFSNSTDISVEAGGQVNFYGSNSLGKIQSSGAISNYGKLSVREASTASKLTLEAGNMTVTTRGSLGTEATPTTISFNGGMLTITGGAVYAKDTNILAANSYIVVSDELITAQAKGKIVGGSNGKLALWLTGSDLTYTTEYLTAVQNALLGDADIALSFINGVLKKDSDESFEHIKGASGEDIYILKRDIKLTGSLRDMESGDNSIVKFNGHTLTGSGKEQEDNGARVREGQSMLLDNGAMTGFSTAVTIEDGGLLKVQNIDFKDNKKDLENNGTVSFSGTNSLDKIEGKGKAINEIGGTLIFSSASGLGCELENDGTVQLGSGELSKEIHSENGRIKSIGEIISTSKVSTKEFELSVDASYRLRSGGFLEVLESTELNGILEAMQGGRLSMAEEAKISFKEGGQLKLSGGIVIMDAKNLISSDYNSRQDTAVDGQTGLLALRLENASDAKQKRYTKEEYRKAKAALFGESGEKAKLCFIYGTIQAEEGETVVIGGNRSQSSGKVLIDGNTPVLVANNKTAKDADIHLLYEPNRYVRVVDETKRADEATLVAPEIEISNTFFIVRGLEVAPETESVSITLSQNADISFTGGEDAEKSVVAKNGEQAEIASSFIVQKGAQLNFGLAENPNHQKGKISKVTLEDGGFHKLLGNGAGKTLFQYGCLELQNNGFNEAEVIVSNAVLKIGSLKAQGGVIYVDPAYLEASSVEENSLGVTLLVSKGSVVNFGLDLAALKNAASKAGLSIDEVEKGFTLAKTESMLTVKEQIKLGTTGKLIVDASVQPDGTGTVVRASDQAYFGNDSLLVVNGNAITDIPAISSTKLGASASIADGAKLYIANVQLGEDYFILDVEGEIAGATGWAGDDIFTDADMLGATFHYANGEGTRKGWVSISVNSARDIYPNLDGEILSLIDKLYLGALNDVNAENLGARFLSRATNNAFLGKDKSAAGQAMESACRIAMAGTVPQISLMASESLSEAIGNRMSITGGFDSILEQAFTTGLALWITPLWQNQSGFAMEACNLNYGYKANIGGIALGVDYSFNEKLKAGLAFNIGGGYAKSNGELSRTENHMKFWGLGLYGGYKDGRLSVLADVSYTSTYNKLEQELDDRMQMRQLKADVLAAVWSIGIRSDYTFSFDALDLTPHLGLRYMNISSQDYDIKSGGTIAKSDGIRQGFWLLPVGLSLSRKFKASKSWLFTPSVDFTLIPRFGELKASESIHFTGVPGEADLHTQTRDYISYKGTAKIEAKYKDISLHLNYSYEAGSHTSGHSVNASFIYEF